MSPASRAWIVPFRELDLGAIDRVGGKNASLGEMIRSLAGQGVPVPDGFAVTADAYRRHLEEAGLADAIHDELDRLDVTDVTALHATGHGIRARIRKAPLPEAVAAEIREAYAELSREYDMEEADVAVRSSATAEDLPSASFAGQQESYLNVQGTARVLDKVRDCMASLFTDRAIAYRVEHGF
ncbi:MAG TPA: PEP/pyruvate-binding domain-containing protein, partial [Myxococcota bacterium]|nr:PEP/pyruvate-binding domain-containing protein [Myxococcota bacterium]